MDQRALTVLGLLKLWLIYCGAGVLFGGLFYFLYGDQVASMAVAMFAIFAAIGTIIVGTAVWGMYRQR